MMTLTFAVTLNGTYDIILTNNINSIKSLNIGNIVLNSDHVPCNLCVRVKLNFAMNSLQDISSTFYSYDHHDKSKIAKPTIHLSSVNCGKLIKEFDILAEKLIVELNDINTDTNQIEEKLMKPYMKHV